MNFFNVFNKKQKSKYLITENKIQKVAKNSFENILAFLENVSTLSVIDELNLKDSTRNAVDDMRKSFGIDGFGKKYDEKILDNENFRIFCIYKACLESISTRQISTPEYIIYKSILEGIVHDSVTNTSIDSFVLNKFKVDPSVLPLNYKTRIMSIDEFTKATEIIMETLVNINSANTYKSYQEYYDYMYKEVMSLVNILHEKGFYNTHDANRFTLLCIAYKIGIPPMDTFYNKPIKTKNSAITMPSESMRDIQEQIFERMSNNFM